MTKRQLQLFCIIIISVSGLFAIPYFNGVGVNDDGSYVRLALERANGNWHVNQDVFSQRFMAALPFTIATVLGMSVKWLPVVTFLHFVCFLGVLTFFLNHYYHRYISVLIVALFATSPQLLQNSMLATGDIFLLLFLSASVLLCISFQHIKIPVTILGAAAGALWILAFLVKETALFFVPVYMAILYIQMKYEHDNYSKIVAFWKYLISVVSVCFILMGILYWLFKGNPLYPFYTIEINKNFVDSSLKYETLHQLFLRVTVQPLQFLLLDYTFGVLFLLTVIGISIPASSITQKSIKVYLFVSVLLWWVVIPLLVRPWNPLGLYHRIWLPLIVPMALHTAIFLQDLFIKESISTSKTQQFVLLVLFVGVIIASWFSFYDYREIQGDVKGVLLSAIMYLILIGCFFFREKFRGRLSFAYIIMFVLVLPQLGWGLIKAESYFNHGCINAYDNGKKTFSKIMEINPALILTDPNTSLNYGVFNEFKNKMAVVSYEAFPIELIPDSTLLWINKERANRYIQNIPAAFTFAKSSYTVHHYLLNPEKFCFTKVWECETDIVYRYQINCAR